MEHAASGSLNERSEGPVMLAAGIAALIALVGLLSGRAAPPAEHGSEHGAALVSAPSDGYVRTVTGSEAAAATAAREASEAAKLVLGKGGNAYDALIAASFAVSVVRPHSTGIGGGGFVVWRDADGTAGTIDGREEAPRASHRNVYLDADGEILPDQPSLLGPRAAGVPGLVAMLYDLYQAKGTKLPGKTEWKNLVQYGIEFAERRGDEAGGFVVREQLAAELEDKAGDLARFPSTARVFLPHQGRPPVAGERFYQEDLAQTLRAIAADPRALYRGELAAEIERATGKWITREDLASYAVERPAPIVGTYRGYTVISMPPPSSGGVHLVQMLNILEGYDLGSYPRLGADHLHLLAEAMRRAYADRAEYMGGDTTAAIVEELSSKEHAATQRGRIDPRRATLSDELGPSIQIEEGDHTTHLSVVDKHGNAASSTQTINTGLGSKFVVGRTGILLNNEMDDFAAQPGKPNFFGLIQSEANAVKPGRRPLSSMTPTILIDPEGRLAAVVGSPGGSRIITTVLQVIVNVVDFGLPIDQAVAAPRIHHQWRPDALWVDSGVSVPVCTELSERGHVVYYGQKTLGNAQAVQVLYDGAARELIATSDPRGTGEPAAQ
ncbi:MAG: gamma-glutamyltransferase [Planctomycetes bacterium]|nr:gamma-glutamyltransferase [Planctomycetota bacterium]